jgi:hypothetical protein
MLIGQLAFWAGLFGLVCQLAALGLSTWQKAPGGLTKGLWKECQAGGCSDSAYRSHPVSFVSACCFVDFIAR